jgi:hypothetical protein
MVLDREISKLARYEFDDLCELLSDLDLLVFLSHVVPSDKLVDHG